VVLASGYIPSRYRKVEMLIPREMNAAQAAVTLLEADVSPLYQALKTFAVVEKDQWSTVPSI
jgi:hypothetical protein